MTRSTIQATSGRLSRPRAFSTLGGIVTGVWRRRICSGDATGSEGDGSAITNRQPQGGAAGSEGDGSAITEAGNRKVAPPEVRVMVVPSPTGNRKVAQQEVMTIDGDI